MKVRLKFKGMSQIVGKVQMGVLTLVDTEETRQLIIPCDRDTMFQFGVRLSGAAIRARMLPEVLWQRFRMRREPEVEIHVARIEDGEYKAYLYDKEVMGYHPIRISDAVLFSLIADRPVFIEKELWDVQSVPYDGDDARVALPVNVISDEMLDKALQRAIEEENYDLAAHLRDEIAKRKKRNQG